MGKITIKEMKNYGYTWEGMVPLTYEEASDLYSKGFFVYRLNADDTESSIFNTKELEDHGKSRGIFGVEAIFPTGCPSKSSAALIRGRVIRSFRGVFELLGSLGLEGQAVELKDKQVIVSFKLDTKGFKTPTSFKRISTGMKIDIIGFEAGSVDAIEKAVYTTLKELTCVEVPLHRVIFKVPPKGYFDTSLKVELSPSIKLGEFTAKILAIK